jgi:hypothetical protein
MTDPQAEARRHWSAARRAAHAVLREPGALPERERDLLRQSVLPQIDLALAMLEDGSAAEEVARWHGFLPGAVEALAGPARLDPGLEGAADELRDGLDALGVSER